MGWLGLCKHLLGHEEKAIDLLKQALSLKTKTTATETARTNAFIWLQLGKVYLDKDIAEAEVALQQSKTLYQNTKHKWELAQVHESLGYLFRLRSQFQSAQNHLESGLELYRHLEDQRAIVNILDILSANARYSGQITYAVQAAEECYEVALKTSNKATISHALSNLATTYGLMQGRFSDAFSLQKESFVLCEELGNQNQLAWSLSRLGLFSVALGNYQAGQKYLLGSYNKFYQLKIWRMVGWTLAFRGLAALMLEQRHEARKLLTDSIEVYTQIGDARGELLWSYCYLLILDRDQKPLNEIQSILLTLLSEVAQEHNFYPCSLILEFIALLLLEQNVSRLENRDSVLELAFEIRGLCLKFPGRRNFSPNSKIFDSSFIDATALLSENRVESVMARGRSRDLWQMAFYLLEEFPKLGWQKMGGLTLEKTGKTAVSPLSNNLPPQSTPNPSMPTGSRSSRALLIGLNHKKATEG